MFRSFTHGNKSVSDRHDDSSSEDIDNVVDSESAEELDVSEGKSSSNEDTSAGELQESSASESDDVFDKKEQAIQVKYQGQDIIISKNDLLQFIRELFDNKVKALNGKIFNFENSKKSSDSWPFISADVSLHPPKIPITDPLILNNTPLDWLLESLYLKQKNWITHPSVASEEMKKFIKTVNILSERAFRREHKREFKGDRGGMRNAYKKYIIKKVKEAHRRGVNLPKPATPIRFYNIGEYIIGIPTPSHRYATCWGRVENINALIHEIENSVRDKHRRRKHRHHYTHDQTSSSIRDISSTSMDDSLSKEDLLSAVGLVLKKLSVVKNKNRVISREFIKKNHKLMGKQAGNSYPSLKDDIHKLARSKKITNPGIVKKIRDILTGKKVRAYSKSISTLIAAWFLSEVSRYPSSLLSGLLILDLLEAGKIYLQDAIVALHPMSHENSFHDAQENMKKSSVMTPVQEKEVVVMMQWLELVLGSSYQVKIIERNPSKKEKSNEAELKKEFLEKVLKPLVNKRLESFESISQQLSTTLQRKHFRVNKKFPRSSPRIHRIDSNLALIGLFRGRASSQGDNCLLYTIFQLMNNHPDLRNSIGEVQEFIDYVRNTEGIPVVGRLSINDPVEGNVILAAVQEYIRGKTNRRYAIIPTVYLADKEGRLGNVNMSQFNRQGEEGATLHLQIIYVNYNHYEPLFSLSQIRKDEIIQLPQGGNIESNNKSSVRKKNSISCKSAYFKPAPRKDDDDSMDKNSKKIKYETRSGPAFK